MPTQFRPAALVPASDAAATVGAVVRGVREHVDRLVVVDDGSKDATGAEAGRAGADAANLAAAA